MFRRLFLLILTLLAAMPHAGLMAMQNNPNDDNDGELKQLLEKERKEADERRSLDDTCRELIYPQLPSSNELGDCPICFNSMKGRFWPNVVRIRCGDARQLASYHTYCANCANNILRAAQPGHAPRCAMCRAPITGESFAAIWAAVTKSNPPNEFQVEEPIGNVLKRYGKERVVSAGLGALIGLGVHYYSNRYNEDMPRDSIFTMPLLLGLTAAFTAHSLSSVDQLTLFKKYGLSYWSYPIRSSIALPLVDLAYNRKAFSTMQGNEIGKELLDMSVKGFGLGLLQAGLQIAGNKFLRWEARIR